MLAVDDQRPCLPLPAAYNAAHALLAPGLSTPDKVALAVLGSARAERWSYSKLSARIGAAQNWMASEGLRPGDKLLLRLGNTPDVPVAFLAALAAGIIPVPTSSLLLEQEITQIAEELQPQAILSEPGISLPKSGARVLDVNAMREAPDATPRPEFGDPNRLAYILTTSGTTSRPRLIQHAHRAIWARSLMQAGWTDIRASDRILHAGAFNWSYTLGTGLFDPWSVGATALILAVDTKPETLPLLLKRHDATIFAAVPGMFRKLLRHSLPALPKLRHALSAGEKLPDALRQDWQRATGTDIHEAFGQTEVSTFLSGRPARPSPSGTLGFAQPGRAIAILSQDGGPAERGEIGEIAVANNDPGLALNTTAKDASPWIRTGDLGVMAIDGSVAYKGRADDILTAGGYRVSPLEVEDAMSAAPGITGIACCDFRINDTTTVIAAYYTAETPLPDEMLNAHAAEHLAPYKRPRLWVHLDELPRNVNGKLLRRALPGANGKTQ